MRKVAELLENSFLSHAASRKKKKLRESPAQSVICGTDSVLCLTLEVCCVPIGTEE